MFHILPHDESPWDYGETIFAGDDMTQRREILGRLSRLYIAVEGGPGTKHEADVATANDALVMPIGRSGGFAEGLHHVMNRPSFIDEKTWSTLGLRNASVSETATAVLRAVKSCIVI